MQINPSSSAKEMVKLLSLMHLQHQLWKLELRTQKAWSNKIVWYKEVHLDINLIFNVFQIRSTTRTYSNIPQYPI
uniref:Putative ovule protein n=1 Tax=Solanum chacoense TaxID=4108 RepID=A0A0V0H4T0_SOLCH